MILVFQKTNFSLNINMFHKRDKMEYVLESKAKQSKNNLFLQIVKTC